jgi:GNAT superfamily N-acetyltransferase
MIYLWLAIARHFVRWMIRHAPGIAAILIVVDAEDAHGPIGYGTVRYVAAPAEETWAKLGYLVQEQYRGLGLGRSLGFKLIQEAVNSGIRIGGGPLLDSNVTNKALVQKLGFGMAPDAVADRAAPEAKNLHYTADLRVLLEQLEKGPSIRGGRRAVVEFEGDARSGPPFPPASGRRRRPPRKAAGVVDPGLGTANRRAQE